ncbi:hypothetical protein Goklo_026619 [Gossypium klotzschianum]|uniref:RNase H type-1 domain-containing protein n=1 Tax=Gossypium klotzschianum TaxID=34286 RepID=A0A7J8TVK8_9ROSI|nr:hypothetical protein [Gossypium klotzschianum]
MVSSYVSKDLDHVLFMCAKAIETWKMASCVNSVVYPAGTMFSSFFGSRFEKGLFGPRLVKAFAICEALSWLKSIHMENVILESDCLMVVNALLRLSIDVLEVGMLVHDYLMLKAQF